MPCRSDYMEANGKEEEISKVCCLLDELKGKEIDPNYWEGYHPKVYNKGLSDTQCDKLVSELCSELQKLDVSKYSLEMQIWWRDHQRADAKRLKEELDAQKLKKEKEALLSRLTDYEKKLLGIK